MDQQTVLDYFNADPVVRHYVDAATRIGLWRSEAKVFQRVFEPEQTLLELGCGTGRIAFGLSELGFRHVMGVDNAKEMIRWARHLAKTMEYPVHFRAGDATDLEFGDRLVDGAIFGFNGLMQIPREANRRQAMAEVFRVLKPGAYFVFTTHDRDMSKHRSFWERERLRWRRGTQKAELDEYGDRFEATPLGDLYIHVPAIAQIEAAAREAGFRIEAQAPRSALAEEPPEVREFADECRFWVLQRPPATEGGA